jgi:hypothetical protein
VSVSFTFPDYRDTPCRHCGQAYREHYRVDDETLCADGSNFDALNLATSNALELLRWLGLPAEEYGQHPAADMAARCQRRLWDVTRNHDPEIAPTTEGGPGTGRCSVIIIGRRPDYLREKTAALLWLAEKAKASNLDVTWN